MQFEKWVDLDLSKGRAAEVDVGVLYQDDNNPLMLGLRLYNQGEAQDVSGTVSGWAILADGSTSSPFPNTGADDNRAWITVPQAALAVVGKIEIFIRITDSVNEFAVSLHAVGVVRRSTTDTVVNPGTVIPNVTELQTAAQDCVDAAADATAAAAAGVRTDTASQGLDDTQKSNARTNIGAMASDASVVLYTSQTLADSAKEQARENIGAEQAGVLEPWLETITSYTNVSSERTSTNKKIINHNRNVGNTDSSGYYVTDKFTVTPGDVYRLSWKMNYNNYLYVFYNSSDTAFGGVQAANSGTWTTLTNELVTIPSNAVAMRIGYYSTFKIEKQSVDVELVADRVSNYPTNAWYTDRLNGKRWVAIGDSITENNSTASAKYHKLIADATGITVINKGKSGTGYGKTYSTSENFCDRVLTLGSTECDVITIFGSFNDLSLDLGTASDPVSAETIGGYMNGTLDNLFATLPNVSVGIILPTPWWGKTPTGGTTNSEKAIAYCEMLTTIAQKRSIPVLDLFHRSNLHPDDADFRTAFFDNADGTHPNNEGHKKIAPMIQQFLQELVW